MARLSVEEVKKAIYLPLGAPVIEYNENEDSFILMRLFFKALGHMESSGLCKRLKSYLPNAKIIKTWINTMDKDRMSGYECVEFKL